MAAARIEQDRMGETAVCRVLIGGVDVVDHDMTARPARTVRISAVIGRTIDGPAARLHAALLGDAQDRLIRMSDHGRKSDQNNNGDRRNGYLHREPPSLL